MLWLTTFDNFQINTDIRPINIAMSDSTPPSSDDARLMLALNELHRRVPSPSECELNSNLQYTDVATVVSQEAGVDGAWEARGKLNEKNGKTKTGEYGSLCTVI